MFFFVPVKHVGFLFPITFYCKIFFTHTYVLLILFGGIYATKNSHVALLSYIPVRLYTRYITDYDIKLIYTCAEKGIEFVECTELELIS